MPVPPASVRLMLKVSVPSFSVETLMGDTVCVAAVTVPLPVTAVPPPLLVMP